MLKNLVSVTVWLAFSISFQINQARLSKEQHPPPPPSRGAAPGFLQKKGRNNSNVALPNSCFCAENSLATQSHQPQFSAPDGVQVPGGKLPGPSSALDD